MVDTNISSEIRGLSATEQLVSPIWAELLNKSDIGVDDNFFALGGDSMLMMIIQFQVAEKLGVEILPGALLESPTLSQFCAMIDNLEQQSSESS